MLSLLSNEILAGIIILAWILLTIWSYRHIVFKSKMNSVKTKLSLDEQDNQQYFCAYASESGYSQILAENLQKDLSIAGIACDSVPLNQLAEVFTANSTIFLFVSTTGDGEAPYNGNQFLKHLTKPITQQLISSCKFAILGLGDTSYPQFCAFAKTVYKALIENKSTVLFEPIYVDNGSSIAVHKWQEHIKNLPEFIDYPQLFNKQTDNELIKTQEETLLECKLLSRQHVNINNTKNAIFKLQFSCSQNWMAGDIARVKIIDKNQAVHFRDYTIASIPEEKNLQLLVRQRKNKHGQLGIGSRVLTQDLNTGETIQIEIINNIKFHPSTLDKPLILIGSGSGFSGLRAHLNYRMQRGSDSNNWLIFGERFYSKDYFIKEDINTWQGNQCLTKAHLAFSRSTEQEIINAKSYDPTVEINTGYITEVIQNQISDIQKWLNQGASIYVCGSREGMGLAVDAVLREKLGDELLEQLQNLERYRKDIY